VKIPDLHIITQALDGFSHLKQIEALKKANVNCIQLRVKDTAQSEWFEIGRKAKNLLKNTGIKLIVNDNVYLAKEINAAGVHLGKTDMGVEEARRILGLGKIIGGTANTYNDIVNLNKQGVNYLGLGPYRTTTTKKNLAPVIQYFGYEVILKKLEINKIDIPIIAIGGIEIEDVVKLMITGVAGVAVSSAIVKAKNVEEKISGFRNQLDKFKFTSKLK